MRALKPIGIVTALLLQLLPTFADDVITNFMSPIASYQYPEDFSSAALTNGGIMSPIVSYQYLEWPDGILNLQSSPTVSYYYQFLDAPLLNIISTNRVPTTAETTPAHLLPPPSQLEIFSNGAFTTNATLDPKSMTTVLTHGWIPTFLGINFPDSGPEGWPTEMAIQLRANGVSGNIVAWNWEYAAKSLVTKPDIAGVQTSGNGFALGQALLNALGPYYSQKIHFIGHSFGTIVNAYAANYLQGKILPALNPNRRHRGQQRIC
jgi:hypothetical protein